MKNIYETDGLSQEQRARYAATDLPLQVLEENLPALLDRVLRKSKDYTRLYQYQPLIVLLEIERINTDAVQEAFYFFTEEDEKVFYIRALLVMMEGWRKRLESSSLYGGSLELLNDLNGQISLTLSPWFPLFTSLYDVRFAPGQMGYIWTSATPKTLSDIVPDGFYRRFFFILLASISVLHRKLAVYKEEIYSKGTMDPSLAILISFLRNYGGIASRFNQSWQKLPLYYYTNILKVHPQGERKGRVWLSFDKKAGTDELIIPAGTYFPATSHAAYAGYKLPEDMRVTSVKAEKIIFVVAEKNRERFPEAALNYVTAVSQTTIPGDGYTTIEIGLQMKSDVFLLGEGERRITISFNLTTKSLKYLRKLISNVSLEQGISEDEARFKIVGDAFRMQVSTAGGWEEVPGLIINLKVDEGLVLFFRLGSTFPAMVPLSGDDKPAVRLLMNNGAWLFPYSWARAMRIERVHIQAKVSGVRDITIYNELGVVDTNQPFAPFGTMAQRGGWMVFGNYEMTRKKISQVGLDIHWQHIPDGEGGLYRHYREYKRNIDNRSFQVRTQYLLNNEWKPTHGSDTHYLFRTKGAATAVPVTDGALADEAQYQFDLPEIDDWSVGNPENYRYGFAHSGFFRMLLVEPEMGFGEREYRRLFAEVMMVNSRLRRKQPLPEEPIAPLADSPRLSYVAEEHVHFAIGQTVPVEFSYIRPLSDKVDLIPDVSSPIALTEGPDDEGNLMIAFSGMLGESILNIYIETEPLQNEIISTDKPTVRWHYKDVSNWVQIKSSYILHDDTNNLRHSGRVEIQLPVVVTSEMLDPDGSFWVCLAVHSNLHHCARVRNIYTNIVEAEISGKESKAVAFPALQEYRQISQITGVFPAESNRDMSVRMRERISHRNRALLPRDYEELILSHFPQLAKVKCLPCINITESKRIGVVSIVAINARQGNEWPLCEDKLLSDIKRFIVGHVSPFVHIDVVNPKYEEITVFCGISIRKGYSEGMVTSDVLKRIKQCIAPWVDAKESPRLGYSFSVRDLQSLIGESKGIHRLHGIKLIHQMKHKEGKQYMNEYIPKGNEDYKLSPSDPWAIMVPTTNQYVVVCKAQEWRNTIEYGDLELGQTFVIA